MINLGLESLTKRTNTSNSLAAMALYPDIIEQSYRLENLNNAMSNVIAVRQAVRKYGRTKSMETLVGSDMLNLITGKAVGSTETLKEMWTKFVQWIKGLWTKIKAFFAAWFGNTDKYIAKLEARAKEFESGKEVANGKIDIPNFQKIKPIIDALKPLFQEISKELEQLKQDITKEGVPNSGVAALDEQLKKHGDLIKKLVADHADNMTDQLNAIQNGQFITITGRAAATTCRLVAALMKAFKDSDALIKSINDQSEALIKLLESKVNSATDLKVGPDATAVRSLSNAGIAALRVCLGEVTAWIGKNATKVARMLRATASALLGNVKVAEK